MMEEMYGEGWKGMFLVSFLFTWIIGLTPPCLIRFVFLKRPISKIAAVLTSGLFVVINLVVFILLGSQSKTHAALIFVAWVSYGILRISGSASSSEKHNDLSVNAEKDRPAGNTQSVKEDLSDMNDDAFYDEVAEEGDTDNLVQVVWEGSMDDENDEVFFELAQNEIDSGEIVRGLMLKAEVAAGGDEKKARIVYLQARAKQLYKEQLAREYVKQQQEERVLKVIQDVEKRLKRDCSKPVLQDLQKKMMGIEKEHHDMPEVKAVFCDLQYRRLVEKYFSTYEQISDFSFCVLESLLSDIEEFAALYPGSPYEKYWDGVGEKAVLVLDEKKFVETKRLAKGFLKNRHYDAAVRAYKDYLDQYSNHSDEVVNILENKIPKLIKKKPPRVKGK